MKQAAAGDAKPNWRDTLSREGAYALAERIAAYWRAKGDRKLEVQVVATATGTDGVGQVFVVRSNMVRGYPPR